MFNRLNNFIRTSLLGGIVVVLPIIIFIFVVKWLFQFVIKIVHPVTELMFSKSDIEGFLADILAVLIILAGCFLIGLVVKTRLGKWIYNSIENRILKVAPGYSLIKETIMQFVGKAKPPFSSVALARPFGNETLVTALITDIHENGYYTVFVPTGPNPMSGYIFHLKKEDVYILDEISMESAMRSIIGCGVGSISLVNAYQKLKDF
jgi:uncharacterized membrane protein